jgi:putative flavoprotein involved in K+ transport
VLASGTYARTHRPAVVEALAELVPVTTVQDYRSPDALPDGAVLVVGAGQSACQIAEELHLAGRRVVMACGRAGWAPRRIAGRDCFEWLLETAFATITVEQLPSPFARFFANPQLTGQGGGRDLHYRTLAVTDLGAVVLAAGYRPDYASLVPVPAAFDPLGFPLQVDGSSTVVPGLHFLGVHYQRTRLSATLLRVGEDAAVLAEHIVGMPAAA